MDEIEPKSRPLNTPLRQQSLPAWSPILTPQIIIIMFAVFGCIHLPLGVFFTISANRVVEQEVRYDDICAFNTTCTVTMTIAENMPAPVYVYYGLGNFFQNQRRYLKSRSDEQLRGSVTDTLNCEPMSTLPNSNTIIVPCGLIANSYFNDTISAQLCSGSSCVALTEAANTWVKNGIAWPSDKDYRYKYSDTSVAGVTQTGYFGNQLPRVDDEDLMVWMRTAALPTFRKLYRKIDGIDLNKGQVLSLTIDNKFPVSSFSGTKRIFLSTTSWMGGKNPFLGWAYIVVGIICFVLAILFQLKQNVSPRRLGDMTYFPWTSEKEEVAQQ